MSNEKLYRLGQLIRLKRENRGLTQTELASRCGVNRNYIGMLERGERNPSYLSLQKIAKGLGIPINELLTES